MFKVDIIDLHKKTLTRHPFFIFKEKNGDLVFRRCKVRIYKIINETTVILTVKVSQKKKYRFLFKDDYCIPYKLRSGIFDVFFDYDAYQMDTVNKLFIKKNERKKVKLILLIKKLLKIEKLPIVRVRNLRGDIIKLDLLRLIMLGTNKTIIVGGKRYGAKFLFIMKSYLKDKLRKDKIFKNLCRKLLLRLDVKYFIKEGSQFMLFLRENEHLILNVKKNKSKLDMFLKELKKNTNRRKK